MVSRLGATTLALAVLGAGLLLTTDADAASAKLAMLDRLGVSQGTAKLNLPKGSVDLKVTLAPLPAQVDTGDEIAGPFTATIYKAYLFSSLDPALEMPLGDLYPTSKSKAALKLAVKGDLSLLGYDRVVVVAYAKDGLQSFDVLTGTLPTE